MQQHLERGVFLGLLGAVTIAFGVLLWPFFTPILWAVVFSILFYPLSSSLARRLGGRQLIASLLTLLCVLAIVSFAVFGVGALVAREAIDAYAHFSSQGVVNQITGLERHPLVASALDMTGIDAGELRGRIVEIGRTVSASIATQILTIGSNAAAFVLKLIIMLYLIFIFLRNGEAMGAQILKAAPIEREKLQFLFDRFTRTVQALFRGTLIVALAQGVVGGVLFAIAGVESPVLWGVLMALLALVPAAGPAVIWAPTGLVLLLLGDTYGALTVLVGGALIVGLLDNVLRPILIGRDLEMSDALIMLSIIGGIIGFGPSGLIIGPVISALFLAAWSLYEREYREG
jgi:predicted PurR-regulated permease PerM